MVPFSDVVELSRAGIRDALEVPENNDKHKLAWA